MQTINNRGNLINNPIKSEDSLNLKERKKKETNRVDGIFLYGFTVAQSKFYSTNCFAHIV